MNQHAVVNNWTGLTHPNGDPLRLNNKNFVAIDRDRNATYEATYRPQALYNPAHEGFHANNESFLLHEVATNLPIYLPDTGPTDFHLHLPPGGYQLVLVTSGMFTFDYDGRFYFVGPGAVMLQSAIVHRQLFYTWSGLSTEENLKTPQTVVPDPISMGYSGKFLEAFITDPTTFPNPTVVGPDQIDEAETPRVAWRATLCMIAHPMPAFGFRIRWSWKRSTSRWRPVRSSNPPGRFMCAISESRFRAVILPPDTSSQPTRVVSRCCRRAHRRQRIPPFSRKARL
jgi:hypothetical protein